MKLYVLILFSVFSIESALASPDWCFNFFRKKMKLNNFVFALTSSKPSERNKVITTMLSTQKDTETVLLQTLPKIRDPSIKTELIDVLVTVAGIKAQSELIKLSKSERAHFLVRNHSIYALNNLKNPSNTVFQAIPQIIEKISDITLKSSALRFFENKEGKQVVEGFTKLLLLEDKLPETIQKEVIKKILETQKPQVAESIFREALINIQSIWLQVELVKSLKEVGGSLEIRTQSELVRLFNSEDIELEVKKPIIKVLSKTEGPSDETIQLMTQILEDKSSLFVHEYALQFFENKKEEQVFEIYKKSLLLGDKLKIATRQKIIEHILDTREAEVAEAILLEVLSNTLDTRTQQDIIQTLTDRYGSHLTNQTQLVLIDLFKDTNTKFVIKIEALHALRDLENYLNEVLQLMTQISEESPYITFKRIALEFLEKQEANNSHSTTN